MLFICNETLKVSENSYTPSAGKVLSLKTNRTHYFYYTETEQQQQNLLTKEWLKMSSKADFKTVMHPSKDGKVKSQAGTLLC